jgi:hypothetical protein
MEPERPIEKLLRVFAKKRRGQAGAPTEMPPATRRLLQNAAARRASKGGEESFFLRLLALFRRRAAFIVCLVAVGLVGTWWWQNSTVTRYIHTRREQQTAKATAPAESKAPSDSAPPAPAPALKAENERPLSPDLASQRKSGREIAGNNVKQQEMPPAAAPAKERADADLQADAISRSASNLGYPVAVAGRLSELSKVTNAMVAADASLSRDRRVTNFEIAAAGASSSPANGASINGPLADGASIRYYQIPQEKKELDAPTRLPEKLADVHGNSPAAAAVSAPAAVLTSFAVERNGGEMRIVDGDGSVYTGVVKPGSPPNLAAVAVSSVASAAPRAEELRDKKDAGETAQDFYFQVSGTNQSLKRSIVFTGRFLALTNGMRLETNGTFAGGAAGAILKNQPASGPYIEGTVLMDGAAKTEIRAVPAAGGP